MRAWIVATSSSVFSHTCGGTREDVLAAAVPADRGGGVGDRGTRETRVSVHPAEEAGAFPPHEEKKP